MATTELELQRHDLLTELLNRTRQAAGRTLTAGDLLDLLAERAALIERVSAIDAECSRLGVPPAATDPALRRCLEALVELNHRLLSTATAQRDALLQALLAAPSNARR